MVKKIMDGAMIGVGFMLVVAVITTIAWAVDIFTVDRNGVVRFGMSDTGAARFTAVDNSNPAMSVTQSGTGPAAVFNGGNVGIGVATPSESLDVNGNIKISSDSTKTAWVGSGATSVRMYMIDHTIAAGNLQEVLVNGAPNSIYSVNLTFTRTDTGAEIGHVIFNGRADTDYKNYPPTNSATAVYSTINSNPKVFTYTAGPLIGVSGTYGVRIVGLVVVQG